MSKIKTSNNIPISSLGQVWKKGKVLALSALLLFSTQALVSAKTLLEQYLDCDGIEEFAFSLEYPEYPEIPIVYRSGSIQNENFLLLTSPTKMDSIPLALSTNIPLQSGARYGDSWWTFNTGTFYERKVWEDKGIPEEAHNDIKTYGEDCIRIIRDYLLNLGLEHSNFEMEKTAGTYTNLQTQIRVDYYITRWSEFGMPQEIIAEAIDLEGRNLPVTWRNVIEYTENEGNRESIHTITRYAKGESIDREGKEKLLNRITIERLVPAESKLGKESFLRNQFTVTHGFSPAMTYYLQTNKYIGFDASSNQVVRLEPDAPRILKQRDPQKRLWGYGIGGILLLGAVLGSFLAAKRSKHEADVNNNK